MRTWSQSRNSDVWCALAEAVAKRSGPTHFAKVLAHAGLDDILAGSITHADFIGNAAVDELAKLAAKTLQPSEEHVQDIVAIDNKARAVLARMVAVTQSRLGTNCGERPVLHPKPERQTPLLRLAARQGHCIEVLPAKVKCTRCLRCVPRRKLRAWISQGSCMGPPVRHDRPVPAAPAYIGHQLTHASHVLATFGGQTWCWKCGAHGSRKIQKLQSICEEPTERGRRVISRLRKGLHPDPKGVWELVGEARFPELPPGMD